MAETRPASTCPSCGKAVGPSDRACPACGAELPVTPPSPPLRKGGRGGVADVTDRPRRPSRIEEDDDYAESRPRRRRRPDITNPDDEALSWIVPMRESLWAIASGYLGLFSCFPFVGLLPAALAITFGLLALKDIARNKGRRGTFRAWVGIVLGGLAFLTWVPMLIFVLLRGLTGP